MPIPPELSRNLRIPAIVSPMFLVSNAHLVAAVRGAGLIGSFPSLNQRTAAGYEAWLSEIRLKEGPADPAYGVNIIVHQTMNKRLDDDLALATEYKVPLIITSMGISAHIVNAIHSYGGVLLHDVVNMKHAEKAVSAGVDGLVAVCAGAGGHAGTLSPFAFIGEMRKEFPNHCLVLGGSITTGRDLAAALTMGADLAYMGTRFIATTESGASDSYKKMLVESKASDIIYTSEISGMNANFLRPSMRMNGLDPSSYKRSSTHRKENQGKAWKDIWSAGQGVGSIDDIPSVADLSKRLIDEFQSAVKDLAQAASKYNFVIE